MKFRIMLLYLLIPVLVYAQFLQQANLKKLDPKFVTVLKTASANTLQKSVDHISMVNSIAKLSNGEELYGAIIYTTQPDALKTIGIKPNSILPEFVTALVTADDLLRLSNLNEVKYIDAGTTEYPANDVAKGLIGADLLQSGYINSTPYKGRGVIVGIIDTGIDWNHLDFRDPTDPTKSRVLFIWDQTITPTGSELSPSGFTYGVEYTQSQIENEIDGSPAGFVRERDVNGHGSHVAGSAAGNGAAQTTRNYGGIAPEADIIFVKAGNGSFPTTNIVDALTYLKNKAISLGRPMVVNMSLGSNYGPHDGSDPKSVAIDDFSGSGRVAVVAAGNDGASQIHISATIPAGDFYDINVSVPSYTPAAGTGNDYFGFDCYLSNNQAANITVTTPTTPNPYSVTQLFGNYHYVTTDDGSLILDSEVDPANNNTELFVYAYDSLAAKPPKSGTWTIRLTNASGVDETFHGWLYGYSVGSGTVTLLSGNTNYTLGNWANSAIIVGAYVSKWFWQGADGGHSYAETPDKSDNIATFSSHGPTRDGRIKPDIAAPGQGIVSVRSANTSPAPSNTWLMPGGLYLLNQGTSMSSPITAGSVALLLQNSSSLTPADVRSLITSDAMLDSYTGSDLPNNTWGYGKLDIFKAMTKLYNSSSSYDRRMWIGDHFTSTTGVTIPTGTKVAVKFSPAISGRLSGVFIHPRNISALSGPVVVELWSDNGSGLPGSKISDLFSLDQTRVAGYSFNFLSTLSANVNLVTGTTYHVVFYPNAGSASFGFDNGTVSGTTSLNTGSGWATYTSDCRVRPIITQDVSALPVELVAFSASPRTNSVLLNWSTATEVNSYMFEIERAVKPLDGKSLWQKVGEVRANGNSNSPKDYSFEDRNLLAGNYDYRLKMIDNDGTYKYSEAVNAEVMKPLATELMQNFPNPFNPATKIKYSIASDTHVKLKIYNVLGSEVATLADGFQNAGSYSVDFNAASLAAGVYIYKMEAGQFSQTRKFVLLK